MPTLLADPGFVLEPDFYGAGVLGILERSCDEAWEVFLKATSGLGVLLWMDRPWLQARQAKFVQPSADRAFVHFHRKSAGHLGTQIYAPPARHVVDCQVWPLDDKRAQLSFLYLGQRRWPASGGQCF